MGHLILGSSSLFGDKQAGIHLPSCVSGPAEHCGAYQPWSGAQPSTQDVILPQEWGSESPGFFLTRKSFGVSTSFCPILAVISHSDFTAVQTHLELFVPVAAVCSDLPGSSSAGAQLWQQDDSRETNLSLRFIVDLVLTDPVQFLLHIFLMLSHPGDCLDGHPNKNEPSFPSPTVSQADGVGRGSFPHSVLLFF